MPTDEWDDASKSSRISGFYHKYDDYKVEKEGSMVDCAVGDLFVE